MKTSSRTCLRIAALVGALALTSQAHAVRLVSGTVVDRSGQPAPGLNVIVWDVNPGMNTNIVLGEGVTNAQGRFSIRYRNYADPGLFDTNPDIRVTVETQARYATGNWFDQPGADTFGTSTTSNDDGERTTLAWWPGFNAQINDWDSNQDIAIPAPLLTVERNTWEAVRTAFDPLVHGFSFDNPKRNICWGPTCQGIWGDLFRTQQTLCGGMSLTTLKKFAEGRCDTYLRYSEIPADNDDGARLPAALKEEIVTNQISTFVYDPYVDAPNLQAMLAALGANLSSMTLPLFRFLEWQAKQDEPGQHPGPTIGAATKSEWPRIREHLRQRRLPAVLGLVHERAAPLNVFDIDLAARNHQVLVIGYDYSPYYRTATLYIYDPNHPGQIRELRFKEQLKHSRMHIDYDARETRGFFLNVQAPPQVLSPLAQCAIPQRRQDLQVAEIQLRDATALDLAAPAADKSIGAFVRIRNVGPDHISGQVEVSCGVNGEVGADGTPATRSVLKSVQLGAERSQWIRVGLPATTIAGPRRATCEARLVSALTDANPANNRRGASFNVEPAAAPLGGLTASLSTPTWQRIGHLPLDRALTIAVRNQGRLMQHPEMPGSLRLRCTSPHVPWAAVVALPDLPDMPQLLAPAMSVPNPGGGLGELRLLLRPVIKPPFPFPSQLPRTFVMSCSMSVGLFTDAPILPNATQPLPPLGPAVWTGSTLFQFTNDEGR